MAQANYNLHQALAIDNPPSTSGAGPPHDGSSFADSMMEEAGSFGDGEEDEDADMVVAEEKVPAVTSGQTSNTLLSCMWTHHICGVLAEMDVLMCSEAKRTALLRDSRIL